MIKYGKLTDAYWVIGFYDIGHWGPMEIKLLKNIHDQDGNS